MLEPKTTTFCSRAIPIIHPISRARGRAITAVLQSVGVYRRKRAAAALVQLRCIGCTRSCLLQADQLSAASHLIIDRKYGACLTPTRCALCGALADASAGMVL